MSDVVYIAVRDFEQAENSMFQRHQNKIFRTFDVRSQGAKEIAYQALDHLSHCDVIYVSFDVDSLDPIVSKGTGTTSEYGLYFREAKEILNTLVAYDKTYCLEISEINPILDTKNSMGEIGYELLKSCCRVLDLKKVRH